MIKLLKIWMIIVPFTMLQAQEFEFQILISDGNHDQTIIIGINPAGTDSFDIGLDILAPPPPPAGAFDTRLTFLDVDYFKDVRKNTSSLKEFYLSYSPGSGGSIILNWDSSFVNELGEFIIVDIYTGSLFYLDMSTRNYLDISNHPELSEGLKILLTPSIPSAINDGSSKKANLPEEIILSQNYPNPFNPSTNIKFSLAEHANVSIKIYNSLGEFVTELVTKEFEAGYHQIEFNASGYASGVYFYRMETRNFTDFKKLILLK